MQRRQSAASYQLPAFASTPIPRIPSPVRFANPSVSTTKMMQHEKETKIIAASKARALVFAFPVPPFTPYISSNGHIQTILANFFPRPPAVDYTRVTLPTDDGLETLQIDLAGATTLAPEVSGQPVAVLLHGLESCSRGPVTLRLADAIEKKGFKIVALNYRSCAHDSGPPKTLRLYHAGFTDDVFTVLRAIRDAAEMKGVVRPKVVLCGFSLGSSIMGNVLREAGEDAASEYGIIGAFGVCTPFNPKYCQTVIDSGLSGVVYARRLVGTMVRKFEEALEAGAPLGAVDPERVRGCSRIGEIDDNFIAPVFGFKDRYDYYANIDAGKCLKHITVPAILMNAMNDPFFGHTPKCIPTREDVGDAPVRVVVHETGGHCAFLDYDGFHQTKPMYYQRVCADFCAYVHEASSDLADTSKSA